MSFMTMNTFAPLIWGFDRSDPEMRIAREAGWSRSDLVWERLMEAGNVAWREGRVAQAGRKFRAADFLARARFHRTDPRLATSAANLALVHRHAGRLSRAETQQIRALKIWSQAPAAVSAMHILPRSRSSLFHLRMEALHRNTYHGNLRARIGLIVSETRETLKQLTAPSYSARHRHFGRWRGERPTVFDDTRKMLGACLLIVDF